VANSSRDKVLLMLGILTAVKLMAPDGYWIPTIQLGSGIFAGAYLTFAESFQAENF
jgi:hypothetical protein